MSTSMPHLAPALAVPVPEALLLLFPFYLAFSAVGDVRHLPPKAASLANIAVCSVNGYNVLSYRSTSMLMRTIFSILANL